MKLFVLGLLTGFAIICPLVDSNMFQSRQSLNLYCDLDCNGTMHTMCRYPIGGGDACGNELHVYLTLDEKRYILDNINHLRQIVANGDEKWGIGGSQPAASNMMKLVWDRELSLIAKRWSEQCKEPLHDKCRVTLDDSEVGQNVWQGKIESFSYGSGEQIKSRKMTRINNILYAWYNEVKNMNPELVSHYNESTEEKLGNYTQIVWASTTFVGCGYTEIKVSGEIILRFVCNFKPKGNIPNTKIYRTGEPCSSCPNSNCSATFFGLCWNGEESNFLEPENIGINTGISNFIPKVLCLIGCIVLSVGHSGFG